MLKNILSRKGQNMAEYAIIFGVVIAAAVGVSALIKNAVQTKVVGQLDQLPGAVGSGGSLNLSLTANTTRNTPVDTSSVTVEKGGAVGETRTAVSNVKANEQYTVGQ